MPEWLIGLLRCPSCDLAFELTRDTDGDGILEHPGGACDECYPVINGVPRLVLGPERARIAAAHANWFAREPRRRDIAREWSMALGQRNEVVRGFDFEWSRFAESGTNEHRELFEQYFDVVPPESFADDAVVLDAGCGAGRWALEVARRGPRVVAVDLGLSIDIAHSRLGAHERIAFVQCDLRTLPLRSASFDWSYSLGVLHHVDDPEKALLSIVRAMRPAAGCLLYLYYSLDNRGPLFRGVFRAVNQVRMVTSVLPRPVVGAFATAVASFVYLPLARISWLLTVSGARKLADALPLSFYRDLSFRTMRNDSLDRFGTPLERRYSRAEFLELTSSCGLTEVAFSPLPPFWHAWARRSRRAD